MDPTSGQPLGQAQHIQQAFEEVRKWSLLDIISSLFCLFLQMFHSHNVDLFIAGHTHMYQRALPTYRGKVDPNGMPQVIAGAGGSWEG